MKRIADDVKLGNNVKVYDFTNLYGCEIGDDTMVGPFVEIQRDVKIGARCRIQSHTLIAEGMTIGDDVFVGHGVQFTNDMHPRANADYDMKGPTVMNGASIGSNATILPGVTIGEKAMVGAGSVVTKDVAPFTVVAGNPAKFMRKIDD